MAQVENYRTYAGPVEGAVSIQRPSIFGNPYPVTRGRSRSEAIRLFEVYARRRMAEDSDFRKAVADLHGKTLLCSCKPKACHGDVLVLLAKEQLLFS